jgi:hypothetical protein
MEDGKILFYKPNLEMQLILDEYRNLGKGRTVEFCKYCGFRMLKPRPTPRNVELICPGCLAARAKRFNDFMSSIAHRSMMVNPPLIINMNIV